MSHWVSSFLGGGNSVVGLKRVSGSIDEEESAVWETEESIRKEE